MVVLSAMIGCGLLGLPDADVADVALTHLGLEGASLEVAVAIDNPLWVELPIEAFRWDLTVAGQRVAEGIHDAPVVLEPGADSLVAIPIHFRYADLWEVAKASTAQQLPYVVTLQLDAWTPRGTVTVPITHAGTLPRLRFPSLDLIDVDLSRRGSQFTVAVSLHLDLPEGLEVGSLDWAIDVDALRLGQGGIRVGDRGQIVIPFTVDASHTATASWAWWWGEAHELVLSLSGEVITPLGTVPIGLEHRIDLVVPAEG